MAEAHLDHPGDIHWFHGYGPATVLGNCPHGNCAHNAQSVIAWGPSYDRYELVACDVINGCATGCRAWVDSQGRVVTPWLQVDARDESLLATMTRGADRG